MRQIRWHGQIHRPSLLVIIHSPLVLVVRLFATPWTAAHRLPCPSLLPEVWSNSCPSSRWCHPTISSSVIPFNSCLKSFPAAGSFPMSLFFKSSGQSIEASPSTSVLPVKIQGWFLLRLAGLISLLLKGLSGVFSNTIVLRHKFFGDRKSVV